MDDVVLVAGARTAIGKFNGGFVQTPAFELGAAAIRAALERAHVEPGDVDEVVMGQVGQVGPDAYNARRWRIALVGQVIARIGNGSAVPVGGLGAMRRRIAERMLEAKATIAQGSCTRIVDLSGIDRQRRGWTAFFVKALAVAANIRDVGIAVEIPGGLVVPVVHDALGKSVDDIFMAVADLGKRARENALTAADVTGGLFTVTNVGATGTLVAFPLINPGSPGFSLPVPSSTGSAG